MNIDPIEEILEDPDKRAKLMVIITLVQRLIPLVIFLGVMILILRGLGII